MEPQKARKELDRILNELKYEVQSMSEQHKLIAQGVSLSEEVIDTAALSDLHLRKGLLLCEEGKLELAEEFLDKARKLCDNEDGPFRVALLRGFALLSVYAGNCDDSLRYSLQALEAAEHNGLKEETIICHVDIACIYREDAAWSLSADHLHRACELGQGHSYPLFHLADLHLCLGDYQTALRILEEVVPDPRYIRDHWIELVRGQAYLRLGQYQEAIETLTGVSELAVGDLLGNCLGNLAKAWLELGKASEARITINRAIEGASSDWLRTIYTATAAQIEFKLGNAEQGISMLQQIERNVDVLSGFQRSQVEEVLSFGYERIGDFERSTHYLKAQIARVAELKASSALGKLRTLSILLERERHKAEERLREQERIHFNRELHSTTTALLAQTELLANFRDDIRALVRKLPPTDPVIRELKEKLKALPCESVDWERFDAQFKAAHPDFAKNLIKAHPELSSMELRVCSLLRSGLKSQEIGRLLCLSDRTVESHRFSIRKKLKLARAIDLKAYLQKY